jgi:hypothetical protein
VFNNGRYATRGISNEIPAELQFILWDMIDSRKAAGKKLDYLQVFRLSTEKGRQKICHEQEKPRYKAEIYVENFFPDSAHWQIETKIFVIDDGDHSTMMLAEEY